MRKLVIALSSATALCFGSTATAGTDSFTDTTSNIGSQSDQSLSYSVLTNEQDDEGITYSDAKDSGDEKTEADILTENSDKGLGDLDESGEIGKSGDTDELTGDKEDDTDGLTGDKEGESDDIDLKSPPPVPEPATWAMMLVGFAAIGFTVRRKQRNSAALLPST